MDTLLDAKLTELIEAKKERHLKHYFDLIRIPSVKGTPEEGAPFGASCAEAVRACARFGEELGFSARLDEQNRYALLSYGTGDTTLGLFAHSDVVPVGDGWLRTEPFEPVLRDGYVFGRGSHDNKAGVFSALFALACLKDLNYPLHSRIQIFIGSNEEAGMGDISAFLQNEPMPTLSLVPDAAYPCSLGEKGILHQWVESPTLLQEVVDVRSGAAFNVVPDKAVAKLRYTPRHHQACEKAIKGRDATLTIVEGQLLLTAMGTSRHAGTPQGSKNAALLLAEILKDTDSLPASERQVFSDLCDTLSDPFGSGLGLCHEEENFGPLTSVCGQIKCEKGRLSASIDLRYGPSLDPKAVESALDTAWEGRGWRTNYRNNRPGFRLSEDSPVAVVLTQLTEEVAKRKLRPYYMSGGTYSRYLKNSYTVGTDVRLADQAPTPPDLPAGHGGAHQRDECVLLDALLRGVRLLCHALIAIDAKLHKGEI